MSNLFANLLIVLVLGLPFVHRAISAQSHTIYPKTIYSGENVLIIHSSKGIERVTLSPTSNVLLTSWPGLISGCPDSVQVGLRVNSITTDEAVIVTVYECDGSFSSQTILAEDWTIRHEYTGYVEIGRDTCLECFVESTSQRVLDSIVVAHPSLGVVIDERRYRDHYRVRSGVPFRYRICYQPEKEESVTDTVYLHFQRDEPNGGYDAYVIRKPITLQAKLPTDTLPKRPLKPELPPLYDPTTFRNIVIPTAESLEKGKYFYGNYVVVGNIAGYGLAEGVSLFGGGVFVPELIDRLYVGTFGGKYEFLHADNLRFAVGGLYAFSSSEDSDISTFAPYLVGSYGDRRDRVTMALGYGLKQHVTSLKTFNRNALTLALGGNTTIARGWKLAAEGYIIESSGIAPLFVTARHFTENFAFDFGLGFDLTKGSGILFKDAFSGEIIKLSMAPVLSAMWIF